MLSTTYAASCAVSAIGLIGSVAHFVWAGGRCKGRVPLHFDLDGTPSMWVPGALLAVFPSLVAFTAYQTFKLDQAMRKGKMSVALGSSTGMCLAAAVGSLAYAQVVAERVGRGVATGMPADHVKVVLALVLGAAVPCAYYSRTEETNQRVPTSPS